MFYIITCFHAKIHYLARDALILRDAERRNIMNSKTANGFDVTEAQAKALTSATESILEIFKVYNFHAGTRLHWDTCLSWFRGYGKIQTNGNGNRKYIEVLFDMYGDPKRRWKVKVTLQKLLDWDGGMDFYWAMHHAMLYLPKSEHNSDHAWIRIDFNNAGYIDGDALKPMWTPDYMPALLQHELYPDVSR